MVEPEHRKKHCLLKNLIMNTAENLFALLETQVEQSNQSTNNSTPENHPNIRENRAESVTGGG